MMESYHYDNDDDELISEHETFIIKQESIIDDYDVEEADESIQSSSSLLFCCILCNQDSYHHHHQDLSFSTNDESQMSISHQIRNKFFKQHVLGNSNNRRRRRSLDNNSSIDGCFCNSCTIKIDNLIILYDQLIKLQERFERLSIDLVQEYDQVHNGGGGRTSTTTTSLINQPQVNKFNSSSVFVKEEEDVSSEPVVSNYDESMSINSDSDDDNIFNEKAINLNELSSSASPLLRVKQIVGWSQNRNQDNKTKQARRLRLQISKSSTKSVKDQNNKTYVCPTCTKTFNSAGNLARHSLIHTQSRTHDCEYCRKGFTRRDKLILHLNKLHGGGSIRTCPYCPKKKFYGPQELALHKGICKGWKPKTRKASEKYEASKSKFKDRIGRFHQLKSTNTNPDTTTNAGRNSLLVIYHCPEESACSFSSVRKHGVVKHYNHVHIDKSLVKCNYCGQIIRLDGTTTLFKHRSTDCPAFSTETTETTHKDKDKDEVITKTFEDKMGFVHTTSMRHLGNGYYRCPFEGCQFGRKRVIEIKSHYNQAHMDPSYANCRYCARVIKLLDETTLSKHVQSCHEHDETCLHTLITAHEEPTEK